MFVILLSYPTIFHQPTVGFPEIRGFEDKTTIWGPRSCEVAIISDENMHTFNTISLKAHVGDIFPHIQKATMNLTVSGSR